MSGTYKIRRFRPENAEEVSALIARTLRTVNCKDYSEKYIEANVLSHSADFAKGPETARLSGAGP